MRRILAVVATTLAMACGGGGGGDTPAPSTSVVGPAGGTVTLTGGPSIVVPAGALATATTITIAQTGTGPGGNPLYTFGPSGTTFSPAATVRVPVPVGATNPTLYWSRLGSPTLYDVIPATVVGGMLEASVTHFSTAFVGAACTQGAACASATACHAAAMECSAGTPVCTDTGANFPDQSACVTGTGAAGTCTAGVCGAAACIDMSGSWTITQHCSPAYVGLTAVFAQNGCAISATDPVNGTPFAGTVSGANVSGANCTGTVTGNTLDWTCGACVQVLTRAATGTLSISGVVSGMPSGVSFSVHLSGASSATATTNAATGGYSFQRLLPGSYTVTPPAGYTYTPASIQVILSGANVTGQNFTKTGNGPALYTVSGNVHLASGPWLKGVSITMRDFTSVVGTVVTPDGSFYFGPVSNGEYSITPSLAGYTFTPTSTNVLVNGADRMASAIFVATPGP
jgi:hypothetical protein